jgi:15-cis-phytoene synthase
MSTAVQQASIPFAPSESQLAVAYSVCRGIARSAARNFYYAFLLLPRPKRRALCAVYAYMRRCDDLADDVNLPLHERRQKLAEWRDAVHRSLAGHPTDDAVLLALADTQRRYQIPEILLDQLAYGTAMDLQPNTDYEATQLSALQVPYRTFDDLHLYCYRVASVVGLVCIRIFGYRDSAAEPLAERLGLAFQLTNIIRDVKEDAAMGRVYLPQEDLDRFEVRPSELTGRKAPVRLRSLLAAEADRARAYYAAGRELIPLVDEDCQPALWVLLTIYSKLLEKIAARKYNVFRGKIRLSARAKLVILGKGFLKRLA